MTDLSELKKFATTPRQLEIIDAVILQGSKRAAARWLGVAKNTVDQSIKAVTDRAAVKGWSPEHDMTRVVPDPFNVKGVSTYYDADGKPRGQWVKSSLDHEAQSELVKSFIEGFLTEQPKIRATEEHPLAYDTDVIPWIQVGDAHIGMLAHASQTGANFDVDIAVREICAAFDIAIESIPPSERIVINDLGDSSHVENMAKETAKGRNKLDADTTYRMVNGVGVIWRYIISRALERAQHVDFIGNQGNHSRFGDVWLNVFLKSIYEDEPRVNILDNENVFIGYRMGNTFVMVHHSDKCRPERLPDVMQSDFRQDFAETEFHYIDIGHIHHKQKTKESGGVVVESWNTLAGQDQYHHEEGYRSGRSMSIVYRSRTYGEVGRKTIPAKQVWERVRATFGSAILTSEGKRRAFIA